MFYEATLTGRGVMCFAIVQFSADSYKEAEEQANEYASRIDPYSSVRVDSLYEINGVRAL